MLGGNREAILCETGHEEIQRSGAYEEVGFYFGEKSCVCRSGCFQLHLGIINK